MKIQLVSYWRKWWKMWSTWISAIGIAMLTVITYLPQASVEVMSSLPPEIKDSIPPEFMQKASIALWVIALISKFIKQQKLTEEHQNEQNSK